MRDEEPLLSESEKQTLIDLGFVRSDSVLEYYEKNLSPIVKIRITKFIDSYDAYVELDAYDDPDNLSINFKDFKELNKVIEDLLYKTKAHILSLYNF